MVAPFGAIDRAKKPAGALHLRAGSGRISAAARRRRLPPVTAHADPASCNQACADLASWSCCCCAWLRGEDALLPARTLLQCLRVCGLHPSSTSRGGHAASRRDKGCHTCKFHIWSGIGRAANLLVGSAHLAAQPDWAVLCNATPIRPTSTSTAVSMLPGAKCWCTLLQRARCS